MPQNAEHRPERSKSALLTESRVRCAPKLDILADPRFQFDAEAWAAMVEEQRMLIAAAAGVAPAKVRIHVGH